MNSSNESRQLNESRQFVLVPENITQLRESLPGVVVCNLRPEQRNPMQERIPPDRLFRGHEKMRDGNMIADDFERFLCQVTKPVMVAILYQTYGKKICTVRVNLEPVICWSPDGLPRLEFEKPDNWNHSPSMWGNFVLAIAKVCDLEPAPVIVDPSGKHFAGVARQNGIPTQLPRMHLDRKFFVPPQCHYSLLSGQKVNTAAPSDWNLCAGDVLMCDLNETEVVTIMVTMTEPSPVEGISLCDVIQLK